MKKTYYITTIGCQMNKSDSERIAAYLEFYGFKQELNRNKAGLVIVNTCGVRQAAENRNYGLIPEIKKENKGVKVILTGCLSERKDVRRRLAPYVDIWLPITKLPWLYRELGLKEKKTMHEEYLSILPKVSSVFSVFIPIGNGCDNFCSYCVVPFARGREKYRPAHEIITEAESFVRKEYKEITLIAQNVNSYKAIAAKKDLQYFPDKKIGEVIKFPELLKAVAEIKASNNFWIRFVTSHPKDMSDELIKVIAENKRICKHVYLPIQSGDDKVLAAMNRKYTVKHYLCLINKIKKQILEASLTTDVIVGFPGETKKQFQGSVEVFKKVKFDMAYISQYSPRPGTVAAKMKDNVSREEKERRKRVLENILSKTALENNKKLLNKNILVLVEEKNKRGEWLGKNEQGKTIKIKGAEKVFGLEGKFILVKITEVFDFGLNAILC
jgi:tRNA-2-methylthio-N6-dimethylallyladenosine synthase